MLLDSVEGGGPSGEWSQITLGNHHSVGVTPSGELFTWGRGNYYDILKPEHVVKSFVGTTVADVCCSDYTVVVTTGGELFSW